MAPETAMDTRPADETAAKKAGHVKPELRLLVRAPEAAALLAVSEATFWRLNAGGQIPEGVLLGKKCRAWSRRELEEWTEAGCPDRAAWNAMKAAASRQSRRGA
jgi:predicted DNA-binding transcriptional regulator AlpA